MEWLVLLKQNPLWCFFLPFWLLKGKANQKNRIAEKVKLDVTLLPYNQDVIEYIKAAKRQGHDCYLATGTVKKIAEAIADHRGDVGGARHWHAVIAHFSSGCRGGPVARHGWQVSCKQTRSSGRTSACRLMH